MEMNIEQKIGKILIEQKLSVSVAESCTGGLISSRLTDVPGSSKYIKFNMVTYSNEAKIKKLGINAETISAHGAVSQETAGEMAFKIKELANTDIGIGITGIAGPGGGSLQKPVGLVYVGLCFKDEVQTHRLLFPSHLERTEIKRKASDEALKFLETLLKQIEK